MYLPTHSQIVNIHKKKLKKGLHMTPSPYDAFEQPFDES